MQLDWTPEEEHRSNPHPVITFIHHYRTSITRSLRWSIEPWWQPRSSSVASFWFVCLLVSSSGQMLDHEMMNTMPLSLGMYICVGWLSRTKHFHHNCFVSFPMTLGKLQLLTTNDCDKCKTNYIWYSSIHSIYNIHQPFAIYFCIIQWKLIKMN